MPPAAGRAARQRARRDGQPASPASGTPPCPARAARWRRRRPSSAPASAPGRCAARRRSTASSRGTSPASSWRSTTRTAACWPASILGRRALRRPDRDRPAHLAEPLSFSQPGSTPFGKERPMHLRDGLQTRVTVAQRYEHLVERGEVTRDPAQVDAGAGARPADRRDLRQSACRRSRARSAGCSPSGATTQRAGARPLHPGRRRARQDHADGHVLRAACRCGASAASISTTSWPTSHDRINRHRQALKRGEVQRGRPDPAGRPRARRGGLGAVLRRIRGHRHRRRHDPVAAVLGAVRERRRAGRDLQRRARRSLSRRPQPAAVRAVHPHAQAAHRRYSRSTPARTTGWRS